jgi:hypothetical protein
MVIPDSAVKAATEALLEPGMAVPDPSAKDISRFQEIMAQPATVQLNPDTVVRTVGDVVSAEQSNVPVQNQGVGDQILNSLQKYGEHRETQEQKVNELVNTENGEPLSVQDMLKLQVALLAMGHERDIITKVVDKTSQGVQSLLRNQ